MKDPDLYTKLMFTNPHLMRMGVRLNLLKHFVPGIAYNILNYTENHVCQPSTYVVDDEINLKKL